MQLLINDLLSCEDSRNVLYRFRIINIDCVRINFLHHENLVSLFFTFFIHVGVDIHLLGDWIFLFDDVVKIIMTNNETFIFKLLYLW